MSPSEADLRAALRDGEDDGRPDVDGVITRARAHRRQRRTRVLSSAAAVVVVAAAAVGGAVVWGGSNGGSAGPQAGSSPSAPPSATRTNTRGQVDAPHCPATFPRPSAPPTGSSPTAAMFSAPVRTAVVCGYTEPTAPGSAPSMYVFVGDQATSLVDSIETASKQRLHVMCPDIVAAQKRQLAIIGVTAGGTALPTVTTDVSIPNCNQPITNGTAVRYAWKPPASVAAQISALTARTATSPRQPTAGNGLNGSPVR